MTEQAWTTEFVFGMTDSEWILEQIKKAETIERLNWLGEVIFFDQEHEYDYAMEPAVVPVREAWKKRKGELSEPNHQRAN